MVRLMAVLTGLLNEMGREVKGSMECGMMLNIIHTILYFNLAWLNRCFALVVLMPPRGVSGASLQFSDQF